MGSLPKQMLAWLAKLLPKQKVQGDRAVQVARVDGDLSTDHSTHHHTTQLAQSGYVGTGAVHMGHVQNATQVHQHFYATALPSQEAASPAPPQVTAAARPPSEVTPEQKQVLALMKPLPDSVRIRVLDFMRREFGTAMVIELQSGQVYRVRRYVEAIHRCKK